MAGTARSSLTNRQVAQTGLTLTPVLLIAGLAIGMEPAIIERLVPLEHPWIQGAIAAPMLLLAPAAVSLAWTDVGVGRIGLWLTVAIATFIALGVIGWVALNVAQIGCQPVTDPIQTVPVGSIWGGVAALGFVLAVRAGRQRARSGRRLAAVAAALGIAVLALVADAAAFLLLFPPLLCAPPRLA